MTKPITVPDAAAILGVSPDTVRRYLQAGRLAGEKVTIGGRLQWPVDPAALAEFPRGGLDTKAFGTVQPSRAAKAAGFAPKAPEPRRRWESVAEMAKAAQAGDLAALVVDVEGRKVKEVAWRKK